MVSAAAQISDYAIIGDCRSAALVSRTGSIDWLCWPRFDSPSLFAAILDDERGGSWRIEVHGARRITRAYLKDTAVLETTFETETGTVVVVDAMTIISPADEKAFLSPEHELLRRVRCTSGHVAVTMTFDPRPSYANGKVRWVERGPLGLCVETKGGLLTLLAEVPHVREDGGPARASFTMRRGEDACFSLTYAVDGCAVLSPLGATAREAIDRTVRLWKEWSSRTRYVGPHRAHVVRSAITIRLLTYAPSGAIVAAATTSLPERPGAEHNWDYRFCWLRDASFTVRGMIELGHVGEASTFVSWLLHTTRLTQPRLNVLYDVFGRKPPAERELAHLRGYGGARPVRIGNAADRQLQLDSYGEVVDAVFRVAAAGTQLDRDTQNVLLGFARYVCAHWKEPDEGIWEPRSGRKLHTHSLVLCWTALDRVIELQRRGSLPPKHAAMFEEHRAAIRELVERAGFDARLMSYTSEIGGRDVDATALLFPWYGFTRHDSPRMRGTLARILEELSPAPGLVYRYADERNGGGAFGISSFWLAEHLALGGGTLEQAMAAFESTLAYANDVGLFAEEIEPSTGGALGNFPQTFTHVGLINAALSIASRAGARAGADADDLVEEALA
jgi:GH15 family glucan-1,4-alpha-glucosidase